MEVPPAMVHQTCARRCRGTYHRQETSDFRHKTSDFRHKTSDTRLQTQDFRLQTQDTSDVRRVVHARRCRGTQQKMPRRAVFLKHKSDKSTQKPVKHNVRRVVHARRCRGTHHRQETSDTRLQTSDTRLQTQDFRLQTQDFRHKT